MDTTWIEYLVNNSSAYTSFLLEMEEMKKRYTESMKDAIAEDNNAAAKLCVGSERAIEDLQARVVLYQQEKATQAAYSESVKNNV